MYIGLLPYSGLREKTFAFRYKTRILRRKLAPVQLLCRYGHKIFWNKFSRMVLKPAKNVNIFSLKSFPLYGICNIVVLNLNHFLYVCIKLILMFLIIVLSFPLHMEWCHFIVYSQPEQPQTVGLLYTQGENCACPSQIGGVSAAKYKNP